MDETLVEDNLTQLCDKALELGAARARAFSARDVVVDERVRLKCLVPRCPYYGRPMCPPNVMPLDDFREMLARYEHALLVQAPITISIEALREKHGDLPLAELYQTPGYKESMRDSFRAFYEVIGRLEAEAFSRGYRFAAGFAAGNYRAGLEDNDGRTTGPEPPFTARPSVEAMGVDVFETAQRAGLPITFPAEGTTAYYTGLVLVC